MKRMPNDWRLKPLGEIADFLSGGTPSRENTAFWNGGFSWFSAKDLKSPILDRSIETITAEGAKNGSRVVPAGTVLILVRGMMLHRDVPVGITSRDSAFNQDIKALRLKEELEPAFVAYSLLAKTAALLSLVDNAGHGTGRILTERLGAFEIPVPPLKERQKIVAILSTWDKALQVLDRLLATKESRHRILMARLLFGHIRLGKFRSDAWREVQMSETLQRVFRPAPKTADVSLELVSIRRRFGGLFRRPDILATDYKTQDLHAIVGGDFLISKRQVVHGAWAFVEPEFAGTLVSKEYAILTIRDPHILDMRFFAWLAQTPQLLRLARISSTGVHIEKLIFDPDVFLKEKIRVPRTVAEQKAIADILDTADTELRLLRKQRTSLVAQKQGLMQLLLTGKKRVRV